MRAKTQGYIDGYLLKQAADAEPAVVQTVAPTPEEMQETELQPGKIYLGTRDVYFGPLPIGRHTFAVFIPRSRRRFANQLMDLGGGLKGIVVGSYNTSNSLTGTRMLEAQLNQVTDYHAARAFLTKDPKEKGRKFAPSLVEVPYKGDVDAALDRVVRRVDNYRRNSAYQPIKYPAFGIFGPNSNTWVQTLLADAGVLGKKRYDMPGFAPGGLDRMDPTYFRPHNEFLAAAAV